MTTTTEPTTTPKVPAWIDLDQVVPAELRAEALDQVGAMRAFLVDCHDRAAAYQHLLERMKDCFSTAAIGEYDDYLDGLFPLLRRAAGLDELEEMGWIVGMMFSPDPASIPNEEDITIAAERHGLLRLMASAVTGNVKEETQD